MDGLHYTAFSEAERLALGSHWLNTYAKWHWLIEPMFWGHEHVNKDKAALWVGNHSMMAFADACLMLRELYEQHGIVMRALAQHTHFKIPIWKQALINNGAVDGTRENCKAMMAAKEHILVYPGGGGEVMKRKGEQHQLRWKKRTGFARMAIENNYPIQPFAAVGADDCWDILYDNNEFKETLLGKLLTDYVGVKSEELPPLIKGIGPTLLPKPQRMYFRFFPLVYPQAFQHLPIDEGALALRYHIEQIVQEGINQLLAYRQTDPFQSLSARLRRKIKTQ